MFFRQSIAWLVFSGIILSAWLSTPPVKSMQAQNTTCAVNLMLVLNAPETLAEDEWADVRQFAQELPQAVLLADEDAGEIHYGVVQYTKTAEVVLPLTPVDSDYLELAASHIIISTLDKLTPTGEEADLATALITAQAEFSTVSNDRANVMVILSGNNTTGADAQPVADTLRTEDTHILSVVVGNIDLSEYVAVSGRPETVITIGQYASLPIIMDILLNNICMAASEPTIPIIDVADGTVTPNSSNGGRATQITFASNRDGDSEIYVVHSDGTNLRQLTDNSADDDKPSFKKDGTQIAFESNRRGGRYAIYVIDIDGTNLTQLTDEAYDSWGPAWSPDGTQIAFHSTQSGVIELFVMNADGSNIRQLTTNGNPIDRSAEWSPDGTQLVFYSDVTGGRELYILDIESGEFERLTNNNFYDGQPDWSMNGTQIAFASTRSNSRPDIFLMQRDDLTVTRLTDDIATDDDPAWSPDGRQIVFETTRSGNYDIWVMDSDGSNPVQITDDPGRDWSADWAWLPVE